MVKEFLTRANNGENVYITEVRKAFDSLPEFDEILCVVSLLEKGKEKTYTMKLPVLSKLDQTERVFVQRYGYARVYNILSTLGGTNMTFYADTTNKEVMRLLKSLTEVFCVDASKAERQRYGKSINVIDRMMQKLSGGTFSFAVLDRAQYVPSVQKEEPKTASALAVFHKAGSGLAGKTLCGMDIGGTDIKIAISQGDCIICFKEYDWFPAKFTTIAQLIDPIVLLTRLVRAKISASSSAKELPDFALLALQAAMHREASEDEMQAAVDAIESILGNELQSFDGIGLCFPDVVIQNKIVGGEVYKTRGIRQNPVIDYEKEFRKLTDLDTLLCPYCGKNGTVRIINDGPMAAFTAAMELSASPRSQEVESGVFAHTLGTELGTGWIDENGLIPDMPLEVYNYIIDLGNYPSEAFDADDVRSINNFNTGLPGTLQKYTSQSGVFRLAVRYFKDSRPNLYEELFKKGFLLQKDGGLYLQTEPKDLRKPFLEYVMELADTNDCPICNKIFEEIGEYLAVTWEETEDILQPQAKSRVLFGRLVKKKDCYDGMVKGAKKINPAIEMFVADGEMANTILMKQLRENKIYTVAQFAQAVGAIYYVNYFL